MQYASVFDGELYFGTLAGRLAQVADMLGQIVADGITPADNASSSLSSTDHILTQKALRRCHTKPCWFYLHARGLLESHSFRDWPTAQGVADYSDAEIFGIGLFPMTARLDAFFSASELEERFHEAGFHTVSAAQLVDTNVMQRGETWYFYNPSEWSEWTRIKPDGEDSFPVTGTVRPEYDRAGADAVVRVYATVERETPGGGGRRRSDKVVWTAAAKPFGYLEDGTGRRPATDASYFALPAFRDVRLIGRCRFRIRNSTSDVEWVRHVRNHLRPYLETGPQSPTCRYCLALATWENEAFRQAGIDWLALYHQNCRVRSPGGRRGGGSRRGH